MDTRDQIAATILSHLLSATGVNCELSEYARQAYAYADEMLKARTKDDVYLIQSTATKRWVKNIKFATRYTRDEALAICNRLPCSIPVCEAEALAHSPHHCGRGVMGEWRNFNEKPESGRRIVAIYDDGSGAHLFYVHDGGFVDEDGEDSTVGLESSYSHWAYLPRGVQLWCETRAVDPLTFPILEPTP